LCVRPVELVRLVAYREVEPIAALRNGVTEQLMEMYDPRSKAREWSVVMACKDMIVAPAKHETEICRQTFRSRIQAAHVNQPARLGGHRDKKFRMARPREKIRNAHAGKRSTLLIEKRVESSQYVFRVVLRDEAQFAAFRQLLALCPITSAGRR